MTHNARRTTHDAERPWIAYTDGASRGNPGLAGCGALIVAPDGTEYPYLKFLGEKTNNQAEYEALLLALENLILHGAKKALIRADSELMVRQMSGRYKVKNGNIQPLFEQARSLLQKLPHIEFEHIRRELNKSADKLANEAIDNNI